MSTTIDHLLKNKQSNIWSVSPDSSTYDALKILAEKDIGALLIIQEKKLVGIFSERDYARKVVLKGKTSMNTPVSEIMSTNLTTVSPETTIEECMSLMTNKHIRHLPVLSKDEVVGIVSIGDIVKAIITKQADLIEDMEKYIMGAGYN